MNVSVFGLSDVGCVTAACLARNGHHVVGVDVDTDKVTMLNAGQSPNAEPSLGDLIRRVVYEKRLRATTDAAHALAGAHAALICVGSLPDGRPDAEAIDHVGREIGSMLGPRDEPLTLLLRSTGAPGMTERVLEPALCASLGSELRGRIRLVVNPQFRREGSSLVDFDEPPMILVGTEDPAAAALVRTIYLGVQAPFVHTSIRTAELAQFAANAYHDLRSRFAAEMAGLADALGADGSVIMRVFAIDKTSDGAASGRGGRRPSQRPQKDADDWVALQWFADLPTSAGGRH
jgi:GDP-mannose 6-dehydrogenase